jgi:peptidylprolyl isomerase
MSKRGSHVRRTAALFVLPLILALSACGGGEEAEPEPDQATLADVTVTGPFGEEPTVDFNAPIVFPETEGEVVEEGPGTGPAVTPESTVRIDYYGKVARDGSVFANSWDDGAPATFPLDEVITGLTKGLTGSHAGDRVLIAVNSKDGYDPTGNGETILEGDSLVFVVDVHKVTNPPPPVPLTMQNFPEIEEDADGNPTGFGPTDATDIPKLQVKVVEPGDGPKVTADQEVTVEYLGQVFPDGGVFDESYTEEAPVSFRLDAVIPGWTQGLTGQRVGSRVVLAIPSDLGYGEQGSGESIPPDSDLIFVVDILKAE